MQQTKDRYALEPRLVEMKDKLRAEVELREAEAASGQARA